MISRVDKEFYYSQTEILFEIIHQFDKREMFFLPIKFDSGGKRLHVNPVRWLYAYAIKFMFMHFDRYNFLREDMNLYHSVATYSFLPQFSYNTAKKSQEQQIWLGEFWKYIATYDLFIETDSEALMESIGDAVRIIKMLDKYKIKNYNNFSGSKGVHIIVPAEDFSFMGLKPYCEEREKRSGKFDAFMRRFPLSEREIQDACDLVMLFKLINFRMSRIYNILTIDTSISDIKRVKKAAYSIDVKSGLVAYPCELDWYEHFDRARLEWRNVLKQNNFKRGLLWRNHDVLLAERQRGVTEMLIDLGILKEKKGVYSW